MKKYILLLLIIGPFLACSAGGNGKGLSEIAPNDFAKGITQADVQILDVRTADEFSSGHIQNAINIDWRNDSFEQDVTKLDKNKAVYIYCLSGVRSMDAAKYLVSAGFKNVYELKGGLMSWRNNHLPETTEAGLQTTSSKQMSVDDLKKLTNTDKIVLVDFYATWCGPCKKMKPYIEEIEKTMPDKVKVISIDVDQQRNLASALNVSSIPLLVVYKKGVLQWSHEGYVSKEELFAQVQ